MLDSTNTEVTVFSANVVSCDTGKHLDVVIATASTIETIIPALQASLDKWLCSRSGGSMPTNVTLKDIRRI